ncbi:hypothetical protein B0H14DRAFT_3854239 [Mycena olivaceomarginata]|nr:hypothetical protein B0H14DRAFT_3854239 [Mycena olivaceomarginata]
MIKKKKPAATTKKNGKTTIMDLNNDDSAGEDDDDEGVADGEKKAMAELDPEYRKLLGKLGHWYWARIRETARREMALQGLLPQNHEPRFRIQVLVTTSQTVVDTAVDKPAKELGLHGVGVNDVYNLV